MMSEQTTDDNRESFDEQSNYSSRESWEAVGQSFKELGESLADVVRAAIDNEENRERFQRMQGDVEAMINQVEQAIQDSAASPTVKKVHEEAVRTMKTLRDTGEDTVQEIRPHLLAALQRVNIELQRVIDDLQQGRSQNDTGDAEDSGLS